MMIGPLVNGATVIIGSISGAVLGERINENMRTKLPLVFGCCSMSLGVVMIGKVHYLPATILAIILGSILGELFCIEAGIQKMGGHVKKFISRFEKKQDNAEGNAAFAEQFVPVLVLFCASGTGIFGAINEGMTGDTTLLMVKSFLDLFTSAIFATSLGLSLATLAVPQFILQAALFAGAGFILPLTTPVMLADFSACGGIIMLATGFRICGIKPFAVANMLPSLFLVMPISHVWALFMA